MDMIPNPSLPLRAARASQQAGGTPQAWTHVPLPVGHELTGHRVAGARYLVVDDNAHMRSLVKELLRGFGVRDLAEAADGADALREIRVMQPDVLITDWRMTPLDGLDLVRILRTASDSPAPHLPVIMLTAFSDRAMVEQARDAGVNEFLVKPLAAQDLWRHVVEVLTRPRPFIATPTYRGPCRRRTQRPFQGADRRQGLPA